jgi:dipeptidyl-peptidase-3
VQAAEGSRRRTGTCLRSRPRPDVDERGRGAQAALFDAAFEPSITAKTPPPGQDIIQRARTRSISGVSLADLQLQGAIPAQLAARQKSDGALREDVYRAGTPDGKCAPVCTPCTEEGDRVLSRRRARVADPAQARSSPG